MGSDTHTFLVLLLVVTCLQLGRTTSEADVSVNCDFDFSSLCGYVPDDDTGLKWTWTNQHRDRYLDPSPFGGKFLTIPRNSDYDSHGQYSRIRSPVFTVTGDKCLYFHYQNSLSAPELNAALKIYLLQNQVYTLLKHYHGHPNGKQWYIASIPLPEGTFQLVLAGRNHGSSSSYISIDDIVVKDGPCGRTVVNSSKLPGDCGFENPDLCGYTNTNDADFPWPVVFSATYSPPQIHQYMHGQFLSLHYRYRYQGSVRINYNDKAYLESPLIGIPGNQGGCLSVYYHNDVTPQSEEQNALNIYTKRGNQRELLYRLPKKFGSKWNTELISLPTGAFQILIEGKKVQAFGTSDYIGVDDIEVFHQQCDEVKTMQPACTTGLAICDNGGTCKSLGRKSFICYCPLGYYGDRCQHTVPCLQSPCQHGGQCKDIGLASYTCRCAAGYYGHNCEHPYPCTLEPCENNGVCTNVGNSNYTCTCTEQYYGEQCQNPFPCTSSPCANEATCTNVGTDQFECSCGPNHHGHTCELDMPCNRVSCRNGGTCENVDTQNFACHCTSNYRGLLCEIPLACASLPCYNGATCSNVGTTGFSCNCTDSYKGTICDTSKDCGDPNGKIPNAVVPHYSSSEVHTEIIFFCKEGYQHEFDLNVRTAKCGEDEQWKVTKGECSPLDCGQPRKLGNGVVIETEYNTTFPSIIHYKCNPGYRLKPNGDGQVSCGTTGRWTFAGDLVCEKIPNCGSPPDVPNGSLVHVTNTTLFGQAEFTCNNGFQMIGDRIAHCYKLHRHSSSTEAAWIFVPSCEKPCDVAKGKGGPIEKVKVEVTKCEARGFSRYDPDEDCEEDAPTFVVKKGDYAIGDHLHMYGGEVCVGVMYTRVNNYDGQTVSKTNSCKSLCLDARGETKRIVTEERLSFSLHERQTSNRRTIYKYKTIPL